MSRSNGLVLGAGGLTGNAFHEGSLAAIADVTGWDPRDADLVVGTSAGAGIGTTLRAGLSAQDQYARARGVELSDEGRALVDNLPPFAFDDPEGGGGSLPAAPQLIATGLLLRWPIKPGLMLAGAMPRGSHPTRPIGESFRAVFGEQRWPDAPLWLVAVRMKDGKRVVFGRDDIDVPDIGLAVEASSAVPGYFKPVRIQGDDYVDGGAHSASNADLCRSLGLQTVIVIAPLGAERNALEWAPSSANRAFHHFTLDREVQRLAQDEATIVRVEPNAADIAVMGADAMDGSRRSEVAEQAYASMATRLETSDGLRRSITG